uniref:2-deoxy-D-gluconate 3-dehydrogenase n=1 Tax=Bionectria ochroleuca TaxID=29856 RepID=A0A8H7NIZ7_BIOOC
MNLFSLAGKTALVTGGTRGIGQSIAVGLAEAGADIILVQRDTNDTATKSIVESLGRSCKVFNADLSDRKDVVGLVDTITSQSQVDILANVAGIMRRYDVVDHPDSELDILMEVNFHTTFIISRDMGKYWINKKIKGRLINTASINSFRGGINAAVYSATKGAVAQLTRAMSNEWAPLGIRVNAIAPGYVATDMNTDTRSDPSYSEAAAKTIPMGFWGKPDDFKGPAIFLASEASSYVTGEILMVDGGWMGK